MGIAQHVIRPVGCGELANRNTGNRKCYLVCDYEKSINGACDFFLKLPADTFFTKNS